jgi:AraC-like DNA-binding protein
MQVQKVPCADFVAEHFATIRNSPATRVFKSKAMRSKNLAMRQDQSRAVDVDVNYVRAAPLQFITEALSAFDLSVEPLLREVGLPHDALSDPESAVPVKPGVRLLALCAERTGRPDFGLLVGQRAQITSMGLVGMLALNAADVGAALRGLVVTLHVHGRAFVPALIVRDGVATLSLSLVGSFPAGIVAAYDLGLAMACNVMRAMCGSSWAPSEVLFPYRPPTDQRPYSRFFKAPLQFNSDRAALVFPAAWLAHRIPGASVESRKALQQGVAAVMSQVGLDILTRVRRALFAAIIQDDVSVENVSRMLGMHRRTLNRRLAENGTTLAATLNDVRFQLARRLMSDTALPLVDIAATLHYADASAFTRAFRTWSGMTPSQWRDRSSA